MSSSFGRLPAPLAQALAARGFDRLTPIQLAVLDAAGPGRDLAICAPTGSGKTLAFGMALASALLGADGRALAGAGPRALVAAPTRDLAAQVGHALAGLYAGTGVRVLACAGGADRAAERAALAQGAEVVVGSPGRLCDHLAFGAFRPAQLSCLVLDEADELMRGGFLAEVRAILAALPASCRLVLCSATLTPGIVALAAGLRGGATPRLVTGSEVPAAPVAMPALVVPAQGGAQAVAALLRCHRPARALVFCRRRPAVVALAAALRAAGFSAVGLTGAMSRRRRVAALSALRDAAVEVCVATDLAGRGLDVEGIGLVVHLGLPHGAEGLVHRNGRAGRGGGPALAVLVVDPAGRRRAEALARRAGVRLDWEPPRRG